MYNNEVLTNNRKMQDAILGRHPCFSSEAHVKHGRIHLPVSPVCNIQCKFCKRSINKLEERPGVSRKILTPEESLGILERALKLCPDITVAGIAGPGDTLASAHALDTFELVHKKHPELIKCLSTNGLMLEQNVRRILEVGVKTITVTVNAVDVDILTNICSHILRNGEMITGKSAAFQLIAAQIEGIRKAAASGLLVKVNTVLVPGINDHHIGDVARSVARMGASMINIIPLIPQFEMSHISPPDCDELSAAREAAEKHLIVFRHCRHCRADACGIPGKGIDIADQLYENRVETFSHG